jgi:hypothetical protein
MNTKTIISLAAVLLTVGIVSCATTGGMTVSTPPEVRVAVVNFAPTTEVGITTEINFSVANLTDQELTGLTLTIATNPSDGLDVPYREMAIDRIAPHGTWSPGPFVVRGRHPGSTAVFFNVTRDGTVLAKDYALVGVGTDDFFPDVF